MYGREANFQHDCRKIQGQASRQVIFKYFFFTQSTKYKKSTSPTECPGFSPTIGTPVLPYSPVHGIPNTFGDITNISFFFFLPSAGNRKEKFQKFQKYEILWSFRVSGKKGRGALHWGKDKDIESPQSPKKPHVPSDQGVNRPPISIVKPLGQSWVLAFGHHIASTVLCYLHCRIWPRHIRTRWNVFFVS